MEYALITGASQGIGKALAEELAKEGNNLILTSRSEEVLEALATHLRETYKVTVHIYAVDLLKKDAVENLYEWCAVNKYLIKILVNNAGVGFYGKFEDVSLEDYLDMIYLNESVLLIMCYTFLPMLKEMPKAHILNVSSLVANLPAPYLSAYAGTKSFVLQFSKALRQELLSTSVNVSCVCPGITETNFYEKAGFQQKGEEFKNMQMLPGKVAEVAIDGMFRRQVVIVPGLTNKIGIFFSRFIPNGLLTELIAYLLKPKKALKK